MTLLEKCVGRVTWVFNKTTNESVLERTLSMEHIKETSYVTMHGNHYNYKNKSVSIIDLDNFKQNIFFYKIAVCIYVIVLYVSENNKFECFSQYYINECDVPNYKRCAYSILYMSIDNPT